MRHIVGLILMAILLLGIINGCDRRVIEVPTNPQQVSDEDAARVLSFQYHTTLEGIQYYYINLYKTADYNKDLDDSDVVEVVIADSVIAMHYYDIPCWGGKGWYAEDTHQLKSTQTVKLRINDRTVLTTNVRAVNKANSAFPATYDPQQPLTLNWYVASGNQYQFVKAEAWVNNMECVHSPYSAYVRQVAAYARTHDFPANCITVEGDPENTTLVLAVQEVNYKVADNTAVMVYQIDSYGYWGVRFNTDREEQVQATRELMSQLSQIR